MAYTQRIINIEDVTHDVKQFTLEKPEGYEFEPGQATEVAVDKKGWRDKKRPFTFTSLNDDEFLQFTIKIYSNHNGVTEEIGRLKVGDSFIIGDPWGTIQYKGEGVFLAGGAGVTPFIAILRDKNKKGELGDNKLIFSNSTDKDVILNAEFEAMLGDQFVSVITDEPTDDHIFLDGFIDKEFLKSQIDDFDQPFYVCGPEEFNKSMMKYLKELGANPNALVFEE